jgi:hypothetical protein
MAGREPSEARVPEKIKRRHNDNHHERPRKKPDFLLVLGKTRFFPADRYLMPLMAAITPIFLQPLH